jgi:hypothetical protein
VFTASALAQRCKVELYKLPEATGHTLQHGISSGLCRWQQAWCPRNWAARDPWSRKPMQSGITCCHVPEGVCAQLRAVEQHP